MTKRARTPALRPGWRLVAAIGVIFIFAGAALAAIPPDELKRETEFADQLIRFGFPDYAQKVMERLRKKDPTVDSQMQGVSVKSLAYTRKYAEAEKILAGLDPNSFDAWATKLEYADICFMIGELPRMRAWYEQFSAKYKDAPPAGREKECRDWFYRYAQRLRMMADLKGSLAAYEAVLKCKPERHEQLQMWTEMAELCLQLGEQTSGATQKKYFDKAKELSVKVQWKGWTVWFGRTIVILAHCEMVRGDRDAARRILLDKTNQDILQKIDAELAQDEDMRSLSPMAEAGYLLGIFCREDAEAALARGDKAKAAQYYEEALRRLYNVFLKYPTTPWSPRAGVIIQELTDRIAAAGLRVSVGRIPREKLLEVIALQFREAKMLLQQQDFDGAIKKYLELLNVFPDVEGSIVALGELAQCYFEKQDALFAQMVVGHVIDRYSRSKRFSTEAGDALLALSQNRRESGQPEWGRKLQDLFVANFPDHPRFDAYIIYMGDEKVRAEDYDRAVEYYRRIGPKSSSYNDALNKIAHCFIQKKDLTNAVAALEKYVGRVKPSPDLPPAKYRLGRAYADMGRGMEAVAVFDDLIKRLADPAMAKTYAYKSEDVERNRRLSELSLYGEAIALSKMTQPTNEVPRFQDAAIKLCERFVEQYPQSDLAPTVLSHMGVMLIMRGRPQDADKTYERLRRDYKDSEQAKNAAFARYWVFKELGKIDKIKGVVDDMVARPDSYTENQFLTVGKDMLDEKEYDLAIRSLIKPATKSRERAVNEPALFHLGAAYMEIKDYTKAIDALQQLFAKYPNTGFTTTASYLLGEAYAKVAERQQNADARKKMFGEARKAIKRAATVARTTDENARVQSKLGRVLKIEGNMADATSVYLRLFLYGDRENPKARVEIEEAFGELVPLLVQQKRWRDSYDMCEDYLRNFAGGKNDGNAKVWRAKAAVELGIEKPAAVAPAAAPTTNAPPPAAAPAEQAAPVPPQPPATNAAAAAAAKP